MSKLIYIGLLTFLVFTGGIIQAQEVAAIKNENYHNVEVTLNFGNEAFVPTLSYQYAFALGRNGNFIIGPGLRLFGISSNNSWRFAETNAPEDNFNDGDKNVNAFIADQTRIFGTSLGLYLAYRINKFEIGMNTDVIGFTISNSVSGNYEDINTGNRISVNNIKSERLILFPINGSYITEIFWAGYRFTHKSMLKLGITFADFKYNVPNEEVSGINIPEEKFERIFTTFTIGYSIKL